MIKRCLLLERKARSNLNSILKSRDSTFPTKVPSSQSYGFPVVMYGCASWTIKKAEHRRIDVFELRCWRRLEKPVLNIHWKDWRWSWNSNTLATWCKELTHWKRPWCWERLKVGGEGDDRGWNGWMALLTGWTWVWASSGSWWWSGRPGVLQSVGLQRVGHDWGTELSWMRTVPDPCPDCWYWREATAELFLNHPQLPGSKPVLYRIVCIGILSMKNKILLLKRFRSDSCKQYYCYKEFQKLESISSVFCLITFRDTVFFSVLRWCSNMLSAWFFFIDSIRIHLPLFLS